MSIQAAQLVAEVKVTGDSEAKNKLKSVGETAGKVGEGFKSMLGGALSFAGGLGIYNLAGSAIGFVKEQLGGIFEESMNAQAGMALTNSVLKSTHDASGETAQSIADLAGNLSHLTKFSDDTTQAAENMLLTFTNIGKNVFPEATKTVLDMSQALGQDTKSSAIQLGKALNDPLTGITALQRVGVTFDQTQKNLIGSYIKHNQVAQAQGVILKELQREFGGAAVAAGKTFGGQLAIAQQYLDDLKQNIGDAVLPVFIQFVGILTKDVMPELGKFSDWILKEANPYIQTFSGWLKQAGDALQQLTAPVQKAHDAVKPLLDSFDRASGFIKGTTKAAQPMLDTFDRGKDIFEATTTKAKPMVDSFDRGRSIIADMSKKFGEAHQSINPFLQTIKELTPLAKDLFGFVGDLAGILETFAGNVLDAFNNSGALQAVLQTIHDILPDIKDFIGNLADKISRDLLPPVLSLVKNFSDWLDKSGFLHDSIGFLNDVLSTAIDWVSGLAGWLSNLFGWLDKNKPAAYALKDAIFAIGGVIAGIKILQFGKDVFSTLKDATGHVKDFIGEVGKIKDKLGDVLDFFKTKFGPGAKGALDDVGKAADETRTTVETDSKEMGGALSTDIDEGATKADAGIAGIATTADTTTGQVETDATSMAGALSGIAGQLAGLGLMAASLSGVNADQSYANQPSDPNAQSDMSSLWHKIHPLDEGMPPPSKWSAQDYQAMMSMWAKFFPKYKYPWINQIDAHASGILNNPVGHIGLVGEQGPELMYVPAGASIFPNNQSMQMMQGNGNQTNQPVILVLDGRVVGRGLMPHIADQIRYNVNSRVA